MTKKNKKKTVLELRDIIALYLFLLCMIFAGFALGFTAYYAGATWKGATFVGAITAFSVASGMMCINRTFKTYYKK